MSDNISTDNIVVAMVFAALELTKSSMPNVNVGSDPQKLASTYKTIYKAVYEAYKEITV
jgi:hypothetical protein